MRSMLPVPAPVTAEVASDVSAPVASGVPVGVDLADSPVAVIAITTAWASGGLVAAYFQSAADESWSGAKAPAATDLGAWTANPGRVPPDNGARPGPAGRALMRHAGSVRYDVVIVGNAWRSPQRDAAMSPARRRP